MLDDVGPLDFIEFGSAHILESMDNPRYCRFEGISCPAPPPLPLPPPFVSDVQDKGVFQNVFDPLDVNLPIVDPDGGNEDVLLNGWNEGEDI